MSRAYVFCLGFACLVTSFAAADAEETKKPRTDFYGDPLPPGAVARLGTMRLRHPGAVAVFSKDGKQLLSLNGQGELRVWDADSGKLVRHKRFLDKIDNRDPEFLQFWHLLTKVAFAPGGATAAILLGNSEDGLFLIDPATGQSRGRINKTEMFAFSPDGAVIALQRNEKGGRRELQLWRLAEKEHCLLQEMAIPFRLSNLAVTADGRHAAGIAEPPLDKDEGTLHLWHTATGKEVGPGHGDPILGMTLAFAPDGKTLAVGQREGRVRLFDTGTLQEKTTLEPLEKVQADGIRHLAFSPDGALLAGSYWHDGKHADESGIFLWDWTRTKTPRRLPDDGYGSWLDFAPDGKRLLSSSRFHTAFWLWDITSGRRLLERPSPTTAMVRPLPYVEMACSPNGKIIASCTVTGCRLWNAGTGEPLPGPWNEAVLSPPSLFSPDSKHFLAVGKDGIFHLWDIATGKELRRFDLPRPPRKWWCEFLAAHLSPDGKQLSAILYPEPAQLFVWDVATGKRLSQRPYKLVERVSERFALSSIPRRGQAAFTPDGELVSIVLEEGVQAKSPSAKKLRLGLEEVATGSLRTRLPEEVGLPVLFSPQGRLLAAATFRPKEVWALGSEATGLSLIETATGEEVRRLDIGKCVSFAFTPDGRGIITIDKTCLRVWDTDTGERLHERPWPDGISPVLSLLALPAGRAATGLMDGNILLWDLPPSTWSKRRLAKDLDRQQLATLWSDLTGEARKAHQAIATLARTPAASVPFLAAHLRPVPRDARQVEKWLRDLDSDAFEVREAATQELTRRCHRIEPVLRRALADHPSPEKRRRLTALLTEAKRPSAEALRTLRAIAVLERLGTPEARRILEKLAGGVSAPETRMAQAVLQRLKHRDAGTKEKSTP